ncbi:MULTISPECIES: hypothetical protein [unclassified Curtobacterium]|uniref:hypothetical protein n=1 Tax=unclassified Curtobacterium TaxID=257496 RepID=UPI000DA7F0E9|nr:MULTISPECIES: hypothetical protein [unclassified Curtobacterium]PZE68008.1 hypothetical protein DEJ27_11375 [Curtobacterium sp. MCPF17_018]PZF34506.1 hypothetical protein DEJ35_01365 [Curtobacterium sp. MCPF17_051]
MTNTTQATDAANATDAMDPRWARVRPLVFRTIIGAVVAAGLIGIIAVLIGDFGRVAVQLLLTVVVVVVFALLSWYDADVSSRRSGTFAFVSIVTSMYLLVAGLVKVWIVPSSPLADDDGIWLVLERFWHWMWLVGVARVALLHVHLLLVIHRRYPTPALQVVAKATVGVIALLALLLSIPLLAPDVDYARGYWRLVWVVVILDLLGTVVVPLSNALFRPRAAVPSATWSVPDPQPAWSATPTPDAPVPAAPLLAAPVPPASPPTPTPAPDTVVASDGRRYAARPAASRALAWPRYVDGTPLPALPDGTPDFSEVTER